LILGFPKTSQAKFQRAWNSERSNKYMKPYFLQIVHKMCAASLTPNKEKRKANINNYSRDYLKEYSDSIYSAYIINRAIPRNYNLALIIVDSL
jgi:hypothetical protein